MTTSTSKKNLLLWHPVIFLRLFLTNCINPNNVADPFEWFFVLIAIVVELVQPEVLVSEYYGPPMWNGRWSAKQLDVWLCVCHSVHDAINVCGFRAFRFHYIRAHLTVFPILLNTCAEPCDATCEPIFLYFSFVCISYYGLFLCVCVFFFVCCHRSKCNFV